MRKWTVEVNIDGGRFYHKITFVVNASMSSLALQLVEYDVKAMGFKPHEYQARIV